MPLHASATAYGDDSSALVAAHLAGDPRAFPGLVALFRSRLHLFLYRMIGDRERAEDLVQEAFLRVYRHLHRFDSSRKFSSWIYTIATNLGRNELRSRRRRPLILHESAAPPGIRAPMLELSDPHTRPDELFAARELQERLDAAVEQLAAHHREVFVLREVEGRSYEEIARISHCTLGTVKSRLNRARHAFAALIGPDLD